MFVQGLGQEVVPGLEVGVGQALKLVDILDYHLLINTRTGNRNKTRT